MRLLAFAWFVYLAYNYITKPAIRKATISVYNPSVHDIRFAYYYEPTSDSAVTKGWIHLAPGGSTILQINYTDTIPNFCIYAESTDPGMVRFIYGMEGSEPGIIAFAGNENDPAHYVKETEFTTRTTQFGAFTSNYIMRKFSKRVAFTPIPFTDTSGSWQGEYFFSDEITPSIYSDEGLTYAADVRTVLTTRAVLLAASLKRQKAFFDKYPYATYQYKYFPGFLMSDHNGMDYPGVTIHSVNSHTILGNQVLLQDGDVLISFNDVPVYGEADVYYALEQHATDINKGIEVPYTAKVRRGIYTYDITNMYSFNDGHYPYNSEDSWRAFKYGLLGSRNMIKLYTTLEGIFKESHLTEEQINFWRTQEWFRLRQQYPRAMGGGEIVSMIFPFGRILGTERLLSIQLVRAGMGYRAANITGSVIHQLALGVYQTIGNASPLQSSEDILSDIKSNTPYVVTSVIISGALQKKKLSFFNN